MAKVLVGTFSLLLHGQSQSQFFFSAGQKLYSADDYAFGYIQAGLNTNHGGTWNDALLSAVQGQGVVKNFEADPSAKTTTGDIIMWALSYPDVAPVFVPDSATYYHGNKTKPTYQPVPTNGARGIGGSEDAAIASAMSSASEAMWLVNCYKPSEMALLKDLTGQVTIDASKVTLSGKDRDLLNGISEIKLSKEFLQNRVSESTLIQQLISNFKITGQDPGPTVKGKEQFGSFEAYADLPFSIQKMDFVTIPLNLDIYLDNETGGMSVGSGGSSAGGGGEISDEIEDEAWAAALAAKEEADAKLLSYIVDDAETDIDRTKLLPLFTRPLPTSSSDLQPYQLKIMDEWWEAYFKAVKQIESSEVDLLKMYNASGSKLPFDEWKALLMSDVETVNTNSDTDGSALKRVLSTLGSVGKDVGSYIGSYSPTEWLKFGAGVTAVGTVSNFPQWAKIGLVGIGVFILLK